MSVYDEVTQAIIAELEQGVPLWVKSWQSHLPRNFISRKEYRGVNVILLWVVANKKGYRSPYWLAGELRGKIRKGEKATGIVYAATGPFYSNGEIFTLRVRALQAGVNCVVPVAALATTTGKSTVLQRGTTPWRAAAPALSRSTNSSGGG
jgi:hypothetical protein